MIQITHSLKKTVSPLFFFLVALGVTSAQTLPFIPKNNVDESDYTPTLPTENLIPTSIDLKESADFPIDPKTYELGPGDIIGVDIFAKVYAKISLKINPQNGVVFPQIGFVSTQGQTPFSLEEQIKPLMRKKVKADSIKVYLEKGKKIRLTVYGSVKKPGQILLENFSRLTEALKEADLLPWASRNNIKVETVGGVKEYDVFKAVKTGDTIGNPMLTSGSKIFISSCLESGKYFTFKKGSLITRVCLPEGAQVLDLPILLRDLMGKNGNMYSLIIKRDKSAKSVDSYASDSLKDQDSVIVNSGESKVFVTGSVPRPGQYSFDPWLSLQQYVSLAGGEDARGNGMSVKLYRNNIEVPVNQNTQVESGDILYVSTRVIVRFNEYLSAMVALATLLIAAKSINAF